MAQTPIRADARRNQQTLLDAAAAVFAASGVDAPVRDIAARAGVGMGTIYRHFPTRAALIVGVYRPTVEALAATGTALLASRRSPFAALAEWTEQLVEFFVTKQGLATMVRSEDNDFDALHELFVEQLIPVCAQLIRAAERAKEVRRGTRAYELMRGIGNLCIGGDGGGEYDPQRLAALLLKGMRV